MTHCPPVVVTFIYYYVSLASMRQFPPLDLKDQLNTYLVGLGEKPSSFYEIQDFHESSDSLDVKCFQVFDFLMTSGVKHFDAREYSHGLVVYAGRDRDALDALVAARHSGDDRQLGAALGFPHKAIDAYCHPTRPRFASPGFFMDLWRAKIGGVPIPAWVGYISHVPAQSDFVSGNVCPQSQWQGEKYRNAIARAYPQLLPRFDTLASDMVPSTCQVTREETVFSW